MFSFGCKVLFLVTVLVISQGNVFSQEMPANADVGPVYLPKPSGPEPVGTKVFHWKDPEREELWTMDPNDNRELMVQIWYPSKRVESTREAPYVFGRSALVKSLKKYWGEEFPDIRHHSFLDAPVSDSRKNYPVLILSHGMNSSRFLYTALSEDLASHGFIVVSIDHTYWGPGVVFPGDRVVASRMEWSPGTNSHPMKSTG